MQNTLSVSSFNLILYAAQQKGADIELLCQKVGKMVRFEINLLLTSKTYHFYLNFVVKTITIG